MQPFLFLKGKKKKKIQTLLIILQITLFSLLFKIHDPQAEKIPVFAHFTWAQSPGSTHFVVLLFLSRTDHGSLKIQNHLMIDRSSKDFSKTFRTQKG